MLRLKKIVKDAVEAAVNTIGKGLFEIDRTDSITEMLRKKQEVGFRTGHIFINIEEGTYKTTGIVDVVNLDSGTRYNCRTNRVGLYIDVPTDLVIEVDENGFLYTTNSKLLEMLQNKDYSIIFDPKYEMVVDTKDNGWTIYAFVETKYATSQKELTNALKTYRINQRKSNKRRK